MGISTSTEVNEGSLTISVSGRFDFSLHEEFRSAYEGPAAPGGSVIIDMQDVDYMDSSALGMLLLLREHVGDDDSDIKIVNCVPEIRNILRVSNFEKLFQIE